MYNIGKFYPQIPHSSDKKIHVINPEHDLRNCKVYKYTIYITFIWYFAIILNSKKLGELLLNTVISLKKIIEPLNNYTEYLVQWNIKIQITVQLQFNTWNFMKWYKWVNIHYKYTLFQSILVSIWASNYYM